jgi:hypothetical protein
VELWCRKATPEDDRQVPSSVGIDGYGRRGRLPLLSFQPKQTLYNYTVAPMVRAAVPYVLVGVASLYLFYLILH